MSVLYLLTVPPPAIEGTEATLQEVSALQSAFAGKSVNLFPLKHPSGLLPKWLYGLHQVGALRAMERDCKLNHVYFSVPYFFPVLRVLRNPLVYTVTASLENYPRPHNLVHLRSLHRIVVSNERDAAALRSWGLTNYSVIPPGIDTSRLAPALAPLPLAGELTLLMASAPWVRRQFDLKGIDVLLETAARLPSLRLILLWRGLLLDELNERVQRLGLTDRIEIVDRKVAIGDYLGRAHATVLLAKEPDIVKAYPHSLLESLVAGKPVLVGGRIPLADYVRQRGCGIVVEDVGVAALTAAVATLRERYPDLARNAMNIGADAFSVTSLVENHRRLYAL